VVYNLTYGLSADPSQANRSYCGPPPYSYQSWLLNATFDAAAGGRPGGDWSLDNLTTVTTRLPGTPTGVVLGTVSASSALGPSTSGSGSASASDTAPGASGTAVTGSGSPSTSDAGPLVGDGTRRMGVLAAALCVVGMVA
jgi:hypothetical protein